LIPWEITRGLETNSTGKHQKMDGWKLEDDFTGYVDRDPYNGF